MSEKYDAYKQLRIDPKNIEACLKIAESLPVKPTLGRLVNYVLEIGIKTLLKTKPQNQ